MDSFLLKHREGQSEGALFLTMIKGCREKADPRISPPPLILPLENDSTSQKLNNNPGRKSNTGCDTRKSKLADAFAQCINFLTTGMI